jgi:hypothetical protein
MSPSHSLSIFHQWLLAEPSGHAPNRTIMLHGDPAVFSDHLIEEIADYLNEYDDEDAGCWLAATSEVVRHVSIDEHLRQLLGAAGPCPNCPPSGPCDTRKILSALSRRGHVVLSGSTPPDKKLELPQAFHAGIGNQSGHTLNCHLVLNPELMDPGSLAHIIGDVYLEWLHRELHRIHPARDQGED